MPHEFILVAGSPWLERVRAGFGYEEEYWEYTRIFLVPRPGAKCQTDTKVIEEVQVERFWNMIIEIKAEAAQLPHGQERLEKMNAYWTLTSGISDDDCYLKSDIDMDMLLYRRHEGMREDWAGNQRFIDRFGILESHAKLLLSTEQILVDDTLDLWLEREGRIWVPPQNFLNHDGQVVRKYNTPDYINQFEEFWNAVPEDEVVSHLHINL